jgi:hypothetical protein
MNRLLGWQRWLLVLLLLPSMTAQAEMYRWVDQQGRVHFSDQPPEQAPARPVEAVKPRRGNVVDAVKIAPPAYVPEVETPSAPAAIPKSISGKGGLVASQAECAAKKSAYQASRACFDACGKTVCGPWGCARNNSQCSQCTDLPMPHC